MWKIRKLVIVEVWKLVADWMMLVWRRRDGFATDVYPSVVFSFQDWVNRMWVS